MSYVRNWRGTTEPPNALESIHNLTWQPIMVRRSGDENRNVGVTAELDDNTTLFEIKAKLTRATDGKENSFIAIVEAHILPMMMINDNWLDNTAKEYTVKSISKGIIILDEN